MIKRFLLKKLHPILKPLSKWYNSKTRIYSFNDITVKVYPGVFHPGLFFSTHVLLNYLQKLNLKDKNILELGAGSGLLSIFCARQGARVTSSDSNPVVIENLNENARINAVSFNIVLSDIFDSIPSENFDIIIINPPYYPRQIQSNNDLAWYCGEDFEYFKKLFSQLSSHSNSMTATLMVLSEECNINEITSLAADRSVMMDKIYEERNSYEANFIFSVSMMAHKPSS